MTREEFYSELTRRGYALRFIWPAGVTKNMTATMLSPRQHLISVEADTFEAVLAELHDAPTTTDVADMGIVGDCGNA